MEAIIFCGIKSSGKTTFYKEQFFRTHVRISLDLLNTRRKEKIFLQTCLEIQQRFAIDNTNITKKDRHQYIEQAKAFKFKPIAYYFDSTVGAAITGNKNRKGKEDVPAPGTGGTYKRLEIPTFEEGFDEIFWVEIVGESFVIKQVSPI